MPRPELLAILVAEMKKKNSLKLTELCYTEFLTTFTQNMKINAFSEE